MANERTNTTNYTHPQENNLLNVHKAMEYNSLGQPILRTTTGSSTGISGSGNVDAFGRQQVATPLTLFDSQHRYAQNDKFWTSTASGGSITHDANGSLVNMTVDTTNGSTAVMETTRVFPYQPGKALEIYATFTLGSAQTNTCQRVGYFGTSNGLYVERDGNTMYIVKRSYVSGSVVNTRVAQTDWNTDSLDGNGSTGVTLDFDKSQILFIDIEWLGVGTVRVGFVVDGAFIVAHKFHHANLITGTYMTTAALPIRYELSNQAVVSSSTTLKHICSTVISSGGYSLTGKSYIAGRGLSYYTMASTGTYYHLASIRLNSSRLDDIIIPTGINVLTDSNQNIEFKLVLNATFASPLSFSTHSNGAVDTSVTDTAVSSNGTELATNYVINKSAGELDASQLRELQLSRSDSTADVLSLIATGDSPNVKAAGNLTWIEPLRG